MSSLLNVSNGNGKTEEFNLNNIELLADGEEQYRFKWAHVEKFVGPPQTEKSLVALDKFEICARNEFDQTHTTATCWS